MDRFESTRAHFATYSPAGDQTVFARAEGVRYIDEDGVTSINLNDIACVLGYGHPRFTGELAQLVQTRMLGHPGMLSPEKERLIRRLMELTHGDFDKLLIMGSGGEAVDWAIKAARKYTGRDGIVTYRGALHGRSFAGAYISDMPFRKEGFGTGLEHVTFWEHPRDGRAFEPAADAVEDLAAVIIEPYQAANGMAAPSPEYWQWLRRYTRERGAVLILDEIQTGFGKTGSMFAYEELGIVPDILLAGKGMSNGFGLGALLLSEQVGAAIGSRDMSGGSADNDLMCAIVNLVLDIFEDEKLLSHVREMGGLFRQELDRVLGAQGVTPVYQGSGLFFSAALPHGLAEKLVIRAKERGVRLGRLGDLLVFRPPLVITEQDVRQVCAVLGECLTACPAGEEAP